jgi:hypothetical protein
MAISVTENEVQEIHSICWNAGIFFLKGVMVLMRWNVEPGTIAGTRSRPVRS